MIPNEVNIWIQTLVHFLLATGEILVLVALNEYTYSEAPSNAKVMVQAIQQLAAAVGSALGLVLGRVSKNLDPVILYASLARTMALSSAIFCIIFKKIYKNSETNEDAVDGIGEDTKSAHNEKVTC